MAENKKNQLSIEEIEKRYPELFKLSEDKLLKEIKLASQAYYNSGVIVMSDERYDSLEIVFKHKFPNNKEIYNVGAKIDEEENKILGFEKHEHTRIKGKTQHKAQNINDLTKSLENFTSLLKIRLKELVELEEITQEEMNIKLKEIGQIEKDTFILSEKLDGVSLYCIYDKTGKLTNVVTRGDGEVGDDITINAAKLNGIQKQLNIDLYKDFENLEFIEIRGEGIMLNENFKKVVKIYENLGKELKNARNATGGIMRRLDGQYLEYVDFMPYEEIIELSDGTIIQRDEKIQMETLDNLGFNTPKWIEVNSLENMDKIYKNYIEKERKKLRTNDKGYEIDGLVIKLNDNSIQNILGMASNRQNGQVAIKFPPEIAITKLKYIEWSESYNGIITPVAVVEPITIGGVEEVDNDGNIKVIGGVTIERLSLANENIMNLMLLEEGDSIVISRRNDVIPKIEKNLKMEETYIEFHNFIQNVIYKELNNLILELSIENNDENKLRKQLIDFKDNIEMDLSSDMFNIELKINKVISEVINNEDEQKRNLNDKQIFSLIFKNFTNDYKKDLIKQLENFEKKYSKDEFVKNKVNELITNFKSSTKELLKEIEPINKIIELNKNNIKFTSNCPTCGSLLISDNSNKICNNSECSNIKIGKMGIFIEKNKNLIVASELGLVDKFFTNNSLDSGNITKENYLKSLNQKTLSLEAAKIWEDFNNQNIDFNKLKELLEDESKKSGIGDAKIKELYENEIATSIKELFNIKLEDFVIGQDSKGKNIYIEGWGERNISNLIKDINKLKTLTDVQFLTGMNFKTVASSRMEKVLQKFNFNDLIDGKVSADDIINNLKGFKEGIVLPFMKELEEKREEIKELLEVIEIKESKSIILSDDEKINFVITGSIIPLDKNNPSDNWKLLEKTMIDAGFSKSKKVDGKYIDIIDRKLLTDYLKYLGHEVQKSVSSTTNYLINVDISSPSSKNKQAQSKNIPIISPEEVIEIILNKSKDIDNNLEENINNNELDNDINVKENKNKPYQPSLF
jgi:NAD-dependent DNA ligase